MEQYIAHIRKKDNQLQSVEEHLFGTAHLSRDYGARIGFADLCELMGLLHDLGKYSSDFQHYIQDKNNISEQDADDE